MKQLVNGYRIKVSKPQNLLRGYFIADENGITFRLARDEDARDLLAEERVGLAFLGNDKLREWKLAGRVGEVSLVDTIPTTSQFVLAGPKEKVWDVPTMLGKGDLLTVATSYPELLKEYAEKSKLNLAPTVTPKGSCEAYAKLGDTDLVYDIRSKGDTLRKNGLVVYREGDVVSVEVCNGLEYSIAVKDTLDARIGLITSKLFRRVVEVSAVSAPQESFTALLLSDPNKLTKKLGEEFAELLQATLRPVPNRRELVNESVDVLNIIQVALAKNGLGLLEVIQEAIRRNEANQR